MPSNINVQTDNLVGYGADKANPGGLIENNDTIGQTVPKPGYFTTISSTQGYSPQGDITLANGKAIQSNTTTGNTAALKAYDVNDAVYKTFATLTNGNTPSFNIAAPSGGTVAIDGASIGATTPGSGAFTTVGINTATNTLVLKQGANGKVGTVILNGVTPVAVATTAFTANSVVIFTLKTASGTVGAYPAIQTVTPATGFTVAGTTLDASTYNWAIIESVA